MKLVVHAGTLRGFGSGVVGRSLIEHMIKARGAHVLAAAIPESWRDAERPKPGGRLKQIVTVPSGAVSKFRFENVALGELCRTFRADRLLSLTDTSLIKAPVPHALLVQQAYLAYALGELNDRLPSRFRRKIEMMSAYMRLGLRHVDHITVQTEHMKSAFVSRWGVNPERVTVIPSAIQPAAAARAMSGREAPDDRHPYLIYVAGAGALKNHRVLAEMMAALTTREPDLRCKLTVRRDDVPELVSRATTLGCLDRFDFLGPTPSEETMALLAHAQLSVMPSLLESFGIPYFEAMALGIPTVAADRPCAREALGDVGLFAPANEGSAWAEAVCRALAMRDQMAEQNIKRHNTLMGWPEIAEAYLKILRDL